MNETEKIKDLAKEYFLLYVEDDKAIQTSLSKYLKKLFKQVDVADNGLEGLELYKKEQYDIVVTDLSMPKMNGLDMIKEIKIINKEQAIIITSAYNDSDYLMSVIKLSIDGYILKPFELHQLNSELYKIVNRLKKFEKSALYEKNLEKMVEEKSATVTTLLSSEHDNYEQTLYSLVDLMEVRDPYRAGHSKRVATYAQMIANNMGYSKEECMQIYQAGMLHDIGKVPIPDAVLLNPNPLNELEYSIIKKHVTISYELLHEVAMFKELSEIVYTHHERYDGEGYPRGIGGDEIMPLGRILIVADAFDAMTTNRIYKEKKSIKEAISEMVKLSGTQFHSEVVAVAKETLKDVVIDIAINQLPKTELEEERFAYFYKDRLTDLYNNSYLELLLARNRLEKKDFFLDVYLIKNFSAYNKEHGWEDGNVVLKAFATLLKENAQESIGFRVFGDDFILLSSEDGTFASIQAKINLLMQEKNLSYVYKRINPKAFQVNSMNNIEKLIGLY